MKIKLLIGIILALVFPLSAFAINAPLVDELPDTINADFYTLQIHSDEGAKITVVGGSADIAPVTDGTGTDEKDGKVNVLVGLAQEAVNTFSIIATLNGQTSSSVTVSTHETAGGQSGPDYPAAPKVNAIPEFVDTAKYVLSGSAEHNSNVYVRKTDGSVAGTTRSDTVGYFQVEVTLEENKTNRFNVSVENEAGNEGPAVQAVVRQSVDLPEEEQVEEPSLTTSAQIFFSDIEGHWAELYIEQLYEDDVVSGKSPGVFDPNGLITRAELTKIAILAFGYSVNTTVEEHPFSDVPRNSWYAPYIEEAKIRGIVDGYPSGGFGPNDFITRDAALKIILSAAMVKGSAPAPDFPDVPIDSWFADYVGYAQANSIVGGYPDGLFHPERNITRAEVAKIVVKVLQMK